MPVRTVLMLLFATPFLATPFLATTVQAKVTQIFIVAGQSNAVGHGSAIGLPEELLLQPDVRYWYDTEHGYSRNSFLDLKPLKSKFGPELNAGRILADHLEDEVAIIKRSIGGTELAQIQGQGDWNPNSSRELYDSLIRNVNAAKADIISQGNLPHVAGLFWMQGESDAKSGSLAVDNYTPPQPETANAYEANLINLIASLRTDLSSPELPVFIGEIHIGDDPSITTDPDSDFNTSFGEWDYTPTVRAAEAAVAAADPRTFLIETQDFSLGSDYLHFDQAGQLALGAAFAHAYLATLPEPSTGCLLLVSVCAGLGFRPRRRRGRRRMS